MQFKASATVLDLDNVIGSRIIPDSDLLTFLTLSLCSSIDKFLWITPIPPSWAIAIAILLSVTVSIAAETIGTFNWRFLENLECNETSEGKTSEYAGTRRTSSNVRPISKNFELFEAIAIKK